MTGRPKARFDSEWFEHLPCSITVCDRNYRILYLNDRSAEVNRREGGRDLIGKSLMDCHPPGARRKLRKVMSSGKPYAFTIQRNGSRKMVFQSHWRKEGRIGGLVEIHFELPRRTPNLVRK